MNNTRDRWLAILKKQPSLILGLLLYGLGISLSITADLGVSPWSVLHMGMANYLPLTFGQAAQLTGFIIIVLTCFIKVIPGLSSLFNMYFVGLFVDVILEANILKTPNSLIGQFFMLFLGMFTIACASYFYLRVELGAGPRDGLMEGLVRLLKRPVSHVRTGIEVSVLVIGYLLGGPVGIGTVITSLFTGTIIQWVFKIGKYNPRETVHMDFIKMVKYLQGKDQNTQQSVTIGDGS